MKQSERPPLTAERLREVLHYSQETGLFVRRVARGGCAAGSVAGCANKSGYVNVRLDYFQYLAHRLAWLYVTGAWPTHEIDHIDGTPTNNRWDNLRDVPQSVNAQNKRRAVAHNELGVLGVRRNHKRYMANITVNRKQIYLGTHDTPELAHAAYLDAKRNLHVGCTI